MAFIKLIGALLQLIALAYAANVNTCLRVTLLYTIRCNLNNGEIVPGDCCLNCGLLVSEGDALSNCAGTSKIDCKLVRATANPDVSMPQNTGTQVISASLSTQFTFGPSLCAQSYIKKCWVKQSSGADYSAYITPTFASNGIFTLNSAGAPALGQSTVMVCCLYEWMVDSSVSLTYKEADFCTSTFKIEITSNLQCTGASFQSRQPQDLFYYVNAGGGAVTTNTLAINDKAVKISGSNTCGFSSCIIFERTGGSCSGTSSKTMASEISDVQITGTPLNDITFKVKTTSPFSKNFCYQCQPQDSFGPQESLDFKISVEADCTSVLTASASNVQIPYTKYPTTTVVKSGFSDYVTNRDSTNCPMSCQMFEQDCSNNNYGNDVSYSTSSGQVTSKTDVSQGHSRAYGIKCTAQYQSSSTNKQTICSVFTVTQLPIDCTGKLVARPKPANFVTPYADVTTLTNVAQMSSFFLEADTDCPITQCWMFESTCTSMYTAGDVEMQVASPWQVSMVQNVLPGYTRNVCFKCTNNNYGKTYTTLTATYQVTQTRIDCEGKITYKSSRPTSYTVAYAGASSVANVKTKSDFFDETTRCPITACSILNADCIAAYSGTLITIDTLTPFQIKAKTDQKPGYTEVICIQCTNNNYGYTYQSKAAQFKVIQTHQCVNSLIVGTTLPASSYTFPYSSTSSTVVVISDSTATYQNLYASSSECLVTSCVLRDQSNSCADAFSGTRLSIGSAPTWAISTTRSEAATWTETGCIVCSNSHDKTTFLFSVTQAPKTCSTSLIAATTVRPDEVLAYDSVTTSASVGDYTSFFQTINATDCPFTSCTLKAWTDDTTICSTETTDYTGLYVTMASSSPWTITAAKNVVQGYQTKVCVQCASDNVGNKVGYDYKITQNPHPCGVALSTLAPTNPVKTYAAAPSSFSAVANSSSTFFSNSGGATCAITSCELRSQGCLSYYATAYPSGYLSMGASNPWAITMTNLAIIAGWTETVCIKCTNGYQTIYYDNWKATQSPHKCYTALSKATPTNPFTTTYDGSPSSITVGAASVFFTNAYSGTSECAITSCQILNSGCLTAYTGDKVYITSSTTVTALRNDLAGYSLNLCLSCNNNAGGSIFQTITYDNYVVKQTSNPCFASLSNRSPGPTNPMLFSYAATAGTVGDWTSFFQDSNTADTNCNPTSCLLFNGDCTASYAAVYPEGKLSIATTTPFGISAARSVHPGWIETVCIQCTNGLSAVQFKNQVIQQAPNQCFSSLGIRSLQNPLFFDYDASALQTIGTWSTFFNDIETGTVCDPTNCQLLATGCVNSYSSKYPSGQTTIGDLASSFVVKSLRSIHEGYTEVFCIKCTNGIQTINFDNYEIRQNPNKCIIGLVQGTITNPKTIPYAASGLATIGTWSDFFTSSDATCDPTSCWLMAPGCTNTYSGSSLQMPDAFQVQALQTIAEGYSEKVCYQCRNAAGQFNYDNFEVIQQPINPQCLTSLTIKTAPAAANPNYIAYNPSSPQNIGGWNYFFTNSDVPNCPVTSCYVMAIGCTNTYVSAYPIGRLTISATSEILAVSNIDSGWSELVCVVCTNNQAAIRYETISIDNYLIVQRTNPCYSAFTAKSTTTPQVFAYHATNPGSIGNWDVFFTDTSTGSVCTPNLCELRAAGCLNTYASAYPSGHLIMGVAVPFTLTAVISSATNWVETVCIYCTNGYQTITWDNFSAVQSNNPCWTSLSPKASANLAYTIAFSFTTPTETVGTWSDFVANSVSPSCDPTSCTLKAKGCSSTYASAYPTGHLSASGTTITGRKNQIPGWTETVCIWCTNTNGFDAFDTQTLDNVVITQQKSPCYTSLSAPATAPTNPILLTYDASAVHSIGTVNDFLTNSDTSNCPVTSCSLFTSGCQTPYSSVYTNNNIRMSGSGASSSFSASRSVHDGYSEIVCISCTNSDSFFTYDTQTYDNLRITQSENPCKTSLSAVASAPANPTFAYDVSLTQSVGTMTDFVVNSLATCPITSCVLMAQGCLIPYATFYPSGRLSISTTTPFQITAQRNVKAGYVETVCVKCTNAAYGQAFDTQTQDNFVVTQTANPCLTAWSSKTALSVPDVTFAYHSTNIVVAGTWQDFVTYTNSPACDATSCTLLAAGCQDTYASMYPSGKLSMGGIPRTSINAILSIHYGWTETVCIKCTNDQPFDTFQTIRYDNFKVTQTENPCKTSLTQATFTNPYLFNYDATLTYVIPGWQTFIANSVAGCEPKACTLYAADCTTPYKTANPSTRIIFKEYTPFEWQMPRNIDDGWSEQVCLICNNHISGYTFDTQSVSITITQNKHPCKIALSPAATAPPNPKIVPYNTATPLASLGIQSTFIDNSYNNICPIVSCQLFNSDCTVAYASAYPAGRLQIGTYPNFEIKAKVDVNQGWTETICLKCNNGPQYDTEMIMNYVVTQQPNPCRTVMTTTGATSYSMAFDPVTTTVNIGTYSTYFTVVEPGITTCPLTSCKLKTPGCTALYSGNKLTIGTSTPWTVTAVQNVVNGYIEAFCIECTNYAGGLELDTKQLDVVVTQAQINYNSICGASTPSLVSTTQEMLIHARTQGLIQITQATFETWFTFTNPPAACKPQRYDLLSSVSPDVYWSDEKVKLIGTIDSDLRIQINQDNLFAGLILYLRATTVGRWADKPLKISSCTKTGSVTVLPPYPAFYGSVAQGASSQPANLATFSSFTLTDVIPGCSYNTLGYQLVTTQTPAGYLQYPRTGAVGCTFASPCLDIEVINTLNRILLKFEIQVNLNYGQDPVGIPAYLWITPCNSQSITATNPDNIVLERTPTSTLKVFSLKSDNFLSKFTLSNKQICPLIQVDLIDQLSLRNITMANLQLREGSVPENATIVVDTGVPVSIGVGLVGYIEGKTATQLFQIRVCGAETLRLAMGGQAINYVYAQTTQLFSMTQPVLSALFGYVPSDPCYFKSFELLTDLYLPWPANDTRVQIVGSLGSVNFEIDKSQVTSEKIRFYIRATTKGLITATQEFSLVVCSPSSLKLSYPVLGTIDVSFGLGFSNGSFPMSVEFPNSTFTKYFKVDSCKYCQLKFYRLVVDSPIGIMGYPDSDIIIDQATATIYLSTVKPFVKEVMIEAYFDPVTQAECSAIISSVRQKMRFTVCGHETLSVNLQNVPLTYTKYFGTDSDFSVDLSELVGNYFLSSSAVCPVTSFKLEDYSGNQDVPEELWRGFIKVNTKTNALEVKHNFIDGAEQRNMKFMVYLHATTLGKVTNWKAIKFEFIKQVSNSAPRFVTLPRKNFQVIIRSAQDQYSESGLIRYDFPEITDDEGDKPIQTIVYLKMPTCDCIQIRKTDIMQLRIDKTKLSSKDNGLYETRIELTDKNFHTSYENNSYSIFIYIDFNITDPSATGFEKPTHIDKGPEYDLNRLQPYLRLRPDRGIKPNLQNERTSQIASPSEVQEVYSSFLKHRYNRTYERPIDPLPVRLEIKNISKDGDIFIQFNQRLLVPVFSEWNHLLPPVVIPKYDWDGKGYANVDQWAIAKFMNYDLGMTSYENQLKYMRGKMLVAHEELNVTRDILDFDFYKRSEVPEEDIQYDLYIKEWEPEFMVLHCNFTKPLLVSNGVLFDEARVKVQQKFLFVSEKTGIEMDQTDSIMVGEFPKQVMRGVSLQKLEDDAAMLRNVMAGMIILMMLIQGYFLGAIGDTWLLYYALQTMAYLKNYDTPMPTNTEIFILQLLKIIEFDIINPLKWFNIWTQSTEYATFSFLDDFSFYWLAIVVFLVLLAFIWILRRTCQKCCKTPVRRIVRYLKRHLFFNIIIRLCSVIYLQLLIKSCVVYKLWLTGQREPIMNTTSIVSFIWTAAIVLYTLFTHFLVWINREQISEPHVVRKISNLYDGIHLYRSKNNIWYYSTFTARRFAFVMIPTFLFMLPFIEVQLIIVLTSFYIFGYARQRPHITGHRAWIELLNESMIMVCEYHLLLFSQFNLTDEIMFTIGFWYILVVVITVAANMITTIFNVINIKTRRAQAKLLAKLKARRLELLEENPSYWKHQIQQETLKQLERDHLKEMLEKMTDLEKIQRKYKFLDLDEIKASQARAYDRMPPELLSIDSVSVQELSEQEESIERAEIPDPDYYKKQIKLRPQILKELEPEKQKHLVREVNQEIFNHFGLFGDLVSQAKMEIIDDFDLNAYKQANKNEIKQKKQKQKELSQKEKEERRLKRKQERQQAREQWLSQRDERLKEIADQRALLEQEELMTKKLNKEFESGEKQKLQDWRNKQVYQPTLAERVLQMVVNAEQDPFAIKKGRPTIDVSKLQSQNLTFEDSSRLRWQQFYRLQGYTKQDLRHYGLYRSGDSKIKPQSQLIKDAQKKQRQERKLLEQAKLEHADDQLIQNAGVETIASQKEQDMSRKEKVSLASKLMEENVMLMQEISKLTPLDPNQNTLEQLKLKKQ